MKSTIIGLTALLAFVAFSNSARAEVYEYYYMPGSSCAYNHGGFPDFRSYTATSCPFWLPARFFQTGYNFIDVTIKNSCWPQQAGQVLQLLAGGQSETQFPNAFYGVGYPVERRFPSSSDYWVNNNGTFTTRMNLPTWSIADVNMWWPRYAVVSMRYLPNWAFPMPGWTPPPGDPGSSLSKSCITKVELYKVGITKGPGR